MIWGMDFGDSIKMGLDCRPPSSMFKREWFAWAAGEEVVVLTVGATVGVTDTPDFDCVVRLLGMDKSFFYLLISLLLDS